MGLFGDRDIEAIDENIFAPPVGTWNGVVGKMELYQFDGNDGQKVTAVKLPIHQEGTSKKLESSFAIDGLPEEKILQALGRLKAMLLALEVPASKMNAPIEELNQALEGVPVVLTTKRNGQYVNIVPTNTGLELKRRSKDPLIAKDPLNGSVVMIGTATTTNGGAVKADPYANL